MKKSLALVMVMGIAGLASANLVYKVNGAAVADGATINMLPGPVSFEMLTDASVPWITVAYLGVNLATTSNYGPGSLGPAWDGLGDFTIEQYGPYGDNFFWSIDWIIPSPGFSQIGSLATVTFDFNGPDATFQVLDGSEEVQASFEFNAIPEPMTMLLLGLGGLLMRRK